MRGVAAVLAALGGLVAVSGMSDGLDGDYWTNPAPKLGDVNGTAVFLKAAAANGAVCLDGSPGAYYFRPGSGSGATKFYIHHQGGGWCESMEDCYGRSQTTLGSSTTYPESLNLGGGYFSQDPTQNPVFYNWNTVFIRYCDGGSYSGNNATVSEYNGKKLFFRGKLVLEAIIDDLLANKGLATATDAVISGCSAGGLATFLHVDHWRSRLSTSTHVAGMPDSGFFLDYQGPPMYHSGMIWVFEQFNSTSGVNDACIAHYASTTGETWKCIFAQWTSPFIQTPTFPLQSEYDAWQIPNDLGSNVPAVINVWGANLTALVNSQLLINPQHGIFLDSCDHHCGAYGSIVIDGDDQASSFQKWYTKSSSKRVWAQNQVYPCASCCQP